MDRTERAASHCSQPRSIPQSVCAQSSAPPLKNWFGFAHVNPNHPFTLSFTPLTRSGAVLDWPRHLNNTPPLVSAQTVLFLVPLASVRLHCTLRDIGKRESSPHLNLGFLSRGNFYLWPGPQPCSAHALPPESPGFMAQTLLIATFGQVDSEPAILSDPAKEGEESGIRLPCFPGFTDGVLCASCSISAQLSTNS